MSEQKSFFDMSPKAGLVLGLSVGIAVVSAIGFLTLAFGDSKCETCQAAVNTNKAVANVNKAANTNTAPAPEPVADADVSKLSPVSDSDYIQGPKDAKVTLIEVSDFQCPYCARHTDTMDQIMREYNGKVRRIWRHLPLTSIHPMAMKAAMAVECAGEQGKFWEMHDAIFDDQENLSEASLKSYASGLKLDTPKFSDCLDNDKYESKIQLQMQEAGEAGISGTPGTFVNGQLVKGAYPFATFKQLIDEALK